jgi:polar amino acid transport system substrate-binding protein
MKNIVAALLLLAGTTTGFAQSAPADAVKDLAPTGKLRAAINLSNIVLAQHGDAGGDPKGVTPDLARELAKRLNVPVELIKFDAAGKVFEAAKTDQWDVAFLAIEPVRAAEIAFTAPYVIIQGTYLVPKDSPLKTLADMDRDGVRVGVNKGSAYDLFLTRTLKNAKLVREVSGPDAFIAQKLEAAAGVKQAMQLWAKDRNDVRHIEQPFMQINQAMGTPQSRGDAGKKYLKTFIEEMKASGFVAKALERSGQADATVAPAAAATN